MAEFASAGRTRSRHAASPVLPEEVVVWDILVRLPARALLRCRAVCRSWLRLTSAADFLLAHHHQQPSLPLVTLHDRISSFCSREHVHNTTIDAFDLRRSPAERHTVLRFNNYNHRRSEVQGSCDGLLLLFLSSTGCFYVCNPATRQRIALHRLAGRTIAGLYRHSSSGEYRVLYRKRRRRRRYHDGVDVYYVLTVGSSAEPRRIGCPAVSSPSLERSMAYISERPPILLHSCLHWGQRSLNHDQLIAFEKVGETFRCISAPAAYNWAWSDLFDMDCMLGVSIVNKSETMVELWVLQDYEMEVWSLKYQIRLPVAELRNITAKHCSFDALIVSENGDMLEYCDSDSHLFHCGSNGKLVQKFRWDCVFPMVTGHWFRESLFRHSFFHNQHRHGLRQPHSFGECSTG